MITSPVGDDAKPWLRQFLAGPGTFALGAATTGALIGFTLQSLGGLLSASALHGAVFVAAAALLLRPIVFTSLRPPSGSLDGSARLEPVREVGLSTPVRVQYWNLAPFE